MREPSKAWVKEDEGSYYLLTNLGDLQVVHYPTHNRWLAISLKHSEHHDTREAAMLAAEDHARAVLTEALERLGGKDGD